MSTSILPTQRRQPFPSPEIFRRRGTSPINVIHTGAVSCATHGTTGAFTFDNVFAWPVPLPGGVIDTLYVESTAVIANAVGRFGIYRNTNDNLLYPSSLIVESGELALATAVIRSVAVLAALSPGLYWFAFHAGVATPTLRNVDPGGVSHLLGMTSAFALRGPLTKAQAYGAFPSTFYAGAVPSSVNAFPACAVHFGT